MTDHQLVRAVRGDLVETLLPAAARRLDDEGVGSGQAAVRPWRPHYRVAEDGMSLAFRGDTSFEDWAAETLALIRASEGAIWCAADAVLWGEDRFGERYTQILDATPYSLQTLKNAVWAARRFPPERRRANVGITLFQAVAVLPEPEQEALLDRIETEKLNREEVRVEVRARQRAIEREQAALAPPLPAEVAPRLIIAEGDACKLSLESGSVDLIVTSPPYGLGKPYPNLDPAEGWIRFIGEFCSEAHRVLSERGRLALNIPLDTTLGASHGFSRPTYADATFAALNAGLEYKGSIVWDEPNVSKSVARGSVDSPSAPHLITPVEMILLLSKGPGWGREREGRTTDLGHDEWLEWSNGRWSIQGESSPWESFEAAFPLEIPLRLIKLLSFKEDVICDPFLGSGTTAIAALKLGRACYGFDSDPLAVASSRRRVARALGGRVALPAGPGNN